MTAHLAYVADVLPSLGEEGVRTCTLSQLVPEGAQAVAEPDPDVARLKARVEMVQAIEPAVRFYEEPPPVGMTVETPWSDVWLSAADWAEAFEAAEPGTPHNEARDQVWEALLMILIDKHDTDNVPEGLLRRALANNSELSQVLTKAWPLLDAADLVGDLWSVPAYLRRCAPWLHRDEVDKLQRADPAEWTTSDLPLLDAARQRLGDSGASRRTLAQATATAAHREQMARVVDQLIATDDSDMGSEQ